MDKVDKHSIPKARANGILIPFNKEMNNYLLIGGSDRNQTFNDIWILSMKEKNWEEIHLSKFNEILTPRSGVAYSIIESNEEHILLYIHGGQNFFTQTFYSDMLCLEINKDNICESKIINNTIFPLDLSKNPSDRNSHCMSYDEVYKKLYIFGGGCKNSLLNDLWVYDLNLKEFEIEKINNIEELIKPRELFGMCLHKNNIIIFGGRLLDGIDKNSYIIDLNNKTCKIGNKLPFALCAFSYAKIEYQKENYIIIYGGTDGNLFSNNFIVYNFKEGKFKKSKYMINKDLVNNDPNYSIFLGRISSMMAYDEKNSSIILYGGSSCDKEWDYINEIPVKNILNEI